MNYLWGGMLMLGIIYGAFAGNMQEITDAVMNSAKEAITLCISMTGVMSLWMGLMSVAQDSGLVEKLCKMIRPFVHFLFPKIPEDHPSIEYITTNMISNALGLGMAATPAGLKAMESLKKLEEERRGSLTKAGLPGGKKQRGGGMPGGVASNEMCTFLILNISSLQLIPVNVIAYD